MTLSPLFTTPTQGMLSHSAALESISNNIANLNTGGFKRTEVRFSTQLLQSTGNEITDTASETPFAISIIDDQGRLVAASGGLDTAIIGSGFLITNTQLNGSGDTLYTRDGSLSVGLGNDITVTGIGGIPITVKEGYLVDRNGYFIQGWLPQPDGTFSNSGPLQSLRVDSYAFTNTGQATTTGRLALNLPAVQPTGATEVQTIGLFDSDGAEQSATLTFTKDAVTNQWTLSLTTSNVGDTVTSAPLILAFNGNGQLTGDHHLQFRHHLGRRRNHGGGPRHQWAEPGWAKDSSPSASPATASAPRNFPMSASTSKGQVIANFQNSTSRPVYKLPLALFTNTNGLEAANGNSFIESLKSGAPRLVAAQEGGAAIFVPGVLELSNVELADEFTRMIIAQAAYNASAMAFRTMDEITQVTAQLI